MSFNPRTRTGCDVLMFQRRSTIFSFQSTHPHGVRLTVRDVPSCSMKVSIHAPARGATVVHGFLFFTHRCFNPRTRTVGDNSDIGLELSSEVSIHAPARGATLARNVSRSPWRFNPRTRTGCDFQIRIILDGRKRFNPRTRTGCDLVDEGRVKEAEVSIHAPARGATVKMKNI